VVYISPSASNDDYDYLFYRETLLNSGECTFKNVTGKDTLWFHDLIQVYTRRTTPALVSPPVSVPSPPQVSSETVTAQLPGNSTTDDLPIAIQKDKRTCTQYPLFNFVSYSYLLFVHLFLLWTIARFSRMYQKHCLFYIELKQCKRR